MRYRLRRADLDDHDDVEHLIALHKTTFLDSAPLKCEGKSIFTYGAWWLMYPEGHEDAPIGFCGVVPSTYHSTFAYLKRAGVLSEHRGQGLQKRMLRVRERWARKHGYVWLVSNTSNDNPASANSFFKSGFQMYWPNPPWDLPNSVYFRKRLQPL